MKRIVAAILAAAFLVALGGMVSGTAGSSDDPFITESYITDTFVPAMISAGSKKVTQRLDSVYDAEVKKLDNVYAASKSGSSGSEYTLAADNVPLTLSSGGTVKAITGATVVFVSGEMSYKVSGGTLINISTGEEMASSGKLSENTRYLCAEDTSVTFTAARESYVIVSGYYSAKGTVDVFSAYLDVAPSDWYYNEAKYIYNNKLYYNYADVQFKPNAPCTRATFVYALWVLSGSPKATSTIAFGDLKEDWYAGAVAWATANNITNGTSDTEFSPDDSVTREQIACFMYRFAKYRKSSLNSNTDLSGYTDAGKISSWALTEMKWANIQGLITGVTNTTLEPQSTATRAQVAAIIMRYAT